jgi:ribosomal protein S18 acetylase RimI-like enzyme
VYNEARASVDCFSQPNATKRDFSSLVRNEKILLAVCDTQVVGFVSIWAPEKFIHHLYIRPENQNKGVASSLIKACIERYGLPLSLKSLAANTNACRFYENSKWNIEDTGLGSEGTFNHYWLREAP